MLKVSIYLVDGGLQELNQVDSLVDRLSSLRHDGYEGRVLVNALITDDWGAPPTGVRIRGTLENGKIVDEYIPYT